MAMVRRNQASHLSRAAIADINVRSRYPFVVSHFDWAAASAVHDSRRVGRSVPRHRVDTAEEKRPIKLTLQNVDEVAVTTVAALMRLELEHNDTAAPLCLNVILA